MASWGRTTVTAAAIAAAGTASLGGSALSLWCAVVDDRSTASAAFSTAVVLAFTVVGAVVAAARPRNAIGWLMLVGGALWGIGSGGADLAHHGIVAAPGSVSAVAAFALGGSAARSVGWYLITLAVPAFFPDGRLAGSRWRWLVPALGVIVVASVVDPLTDPQGDLTDLGAWRNPIAPTGSARAISAVAFMAHVPFSLVVTVAVVAQLVHRWRGGDSFQRQQLTLFAVAAVVPVVAVPISFGFGAGGWVFGAAALPLPFAIGFAVLARGLYDLRTAVNRTLVWVTLSAVVAGVYALVIAGLAGVLHVERNVSWLPWVAAGLVAVSFAPLRDSLQRGVNRLTYGRWDEPYDVLAALGQRVEATADVDRLLADVVTELTGLGLRDVAVCDAVGAVVAGDEVGAEDLVELPLAAYGEGVGTLRFREPPTPLRTRDRRLLEDLAGQLGGVLHAHRLTSDLQLARERLVLAREEERRRLRRDLHDGLGPALAGHLLRLDVLASRVGRDAAVAADLDSLREDLRTTMGELRQVVEGLRPPALDELGLTVALERVTQRLAAAAPVAVTIEADELPPLSAAVEVAAYRIVTEAVTNVLKHAGATRCDVRLTAGRGLLRVCVADDGRGAGRPAPVGHGLQTMRERAEELRGRLRVSRGAGGAGTTVIAELPIPSQRAPQPVAARTSPR